MKTTPKRILLFSLIFLTVVLSMVQVYNGNFWKDYFSLKNSIKNNNIAKVKQAIESGTNVNQPFTDGSTPLINAAENGRLEVII